MAPNLGLEVEDMMEQLDTLFTVLLASTPSCVALLVHDGVLKITKALWQTPFSIPPTSKRAEKKYFIAVKGFEYVYTHPPSGSLIISAANEKDRWANQFYSQK